MRLVVELRRNVGLGRSAGAGAGRIAALCHESRYDTVKHDIVVKSFARELANPLDMAGRQIIAQPDHDVTGLA